MRMKVGRSLNKTGYGVRRNRSVDVHPVLGVLTLAEAERWRVNYSWTRWNARDDDDLQVAR